MLAVTNGALVRRQMGRANVFLAAAMAVFAAGFAVGWLWPAEMVASWASLVAIVLGVFLWQVNQYFVRRWGPRHRQDAALVRALKGLDNRYTLVSFADARLPDYLLVGPQGIRVLVARAVGGTIRCHRDQWSRAESPWIRTLVLGNPVRNPTVEAVQSVSQVERYLARELGADEAARVPVSATIVFTDPKVRLEIEGSRYPVTRARDLRGHVQRDRGSLGPPQLATLRRLFSPPGEATPH